MNISLEVIQKTALLGTACIILAYHNTCNLGPDPQQSIHHNVAEGTHNLSVLSRVRLAL